MTDVVTRYVSVLMGRADAVEALSDALDENVTSVSPMGAVNGRSAVLESMANSQLAGFLANAEWSEPSGDNDKVTVTAKLPRRSQIGGFRYTFELIDGLIAKVASETLPGEGPLTTPILLDGDIAVRVNGALANGNTMMVAYVDDEGFPQISYRGSTHVHGQTQLAIWLRNPEGGLQRSIVDRPQLTLMYRDPATRASYMFYGRGAVVSDEEVRNQVYESTPEVEQRFDAERRGLALVIDVDKVDGRGPGGAVKMRREA